jgi:hypothetical protein
VPTSNPETTSGKRFKAPSRETIVLIVTRQGRIAVEFSVDEATEDKIMYAAIH